MPATLTVGPIECPKQKAIAFHMYSDELGQDVRCAISFDVLRRQYKTADHQDHSPIVHFGYHKDLILKTAWRFHQAGMIAMAPAARSLQAEVFIDGFSLEEMVLVDPGLRPPRPPMIVR